MAGNDAGRSPQSLRFLEGGSKGRRLQVWCSDHQFSGWKARRRRPVHLLAKRQSGSVIRHARLGSNLMGTRPADGVDFVQTARVDSSSPMAIDRLAKGMSVAAATAPQTPSGTSSPTAS